MRAGKFITFEGPEGSGKSTQILRLADFLHECGIEAVVTREPGGTRLGEAIRGMLQFNDAGEPPVERCEALLFFASRAQHVERLIVPALEAGRWVLSDRFDDSTMAYQGYGRGFDLGELRQLNSFATGGLRPDLTFLLDVPPEVGWERLQRRAVADRIESAGLEFHRRLRRGFLELAGQEPERFVVVDCQVGLSEVEQSVRVAVERFMRDAAKSGI